MSKQTPSPEMTASSPASSPEYLPTPPSTLRSFDEYDSEFVDELFMIGKIPFTASSHDNRFSYTLYVPPTYTTLTALPLAVLVHSSWRDATELRDAFIPWADANGAAVLCPLFPQGIVIPEDQDNYKAIEAYDIRFDLELLAMVQDVEQRWPRIQTQKLLMQGFSGGGQFVHRFAYLHPDRLHAAVICAPGSATRLDWEVDFPHGLRGMEERFGFCWDAEALRRVRTLMLVGEDDTGIRHLVARRKYNDATGSIPNRQQVLEELCITWTAYGIEAKLERIPNAAHEPDKMYAATEKFFTQVVAQLKREEERNM